MAGFEPGDLDGLGLLHLDDHVGGLEYRVGIRQDLRPDVAEYVIGEADPRTRSGLDEDLMALAAQALDDAGRGADAKFEGFDLFGDADAHDGSPCVDGLGA